MPDDAFSVSVCARSRSKALFSCAFAEVREGLLKASECLRLQFSQRTSRKILLPSASIPPTLSALKDEQQRSGVVIVLKVESALFLCVALLWFVAAAMSAGPEPTMIGLGSMFALVSVGSFFRPKR